MNNTHLDIIHLGNRVGLNRTSTKLPYQVRRNATQPHQTGLFFLNGTSCWGPNRHKSTRLLLSNRNTSNSNTVVTFSLRGIPFKHLQQPKLVDFAVGTAEQQIWIHKNNVKTGGDSCLEPNTASPGASHHLVLWLQSRTEWKWRMNWQHRHQKMK